MSLQIQLENVSSIQRKMTVTVPADIVMGRLNQGIAEVQRTAHLKGFRKGHAPISVIKQYYGEDIRHRVFHNLIDETFSDAVREKSLRPVGRPQIETPKHKTGEGEHDHAIHENDALTYIATFEIIPEIKAKDYTGLKLKREAVEIKDQDVEVVIKSLQDAHAELNPVDGVDLPNGTKSSRPSIKGDFADINFDGVLITESGKEARDEMKGSRLVELGAGTLMDEFESQVIGMRRGETKTFEMTYPKDFPDAGFAGKKSEFTVTMNELKVKKLPQLDDEFAKEAGYDDLADMQKKAKDGLLKQKTDETEHKLQSDLLELLIEKNPFDVPQSLVQSQLQNLIQNFVQYLYQQGMPEDTIKEVIGKETDSLKKKAESQVRASLILDAVSKQEKIELSAAEIDNEVKTSALQMRVEEAKLRDYYEKNPDRMEDLKFRAMENKTIQFILGKANIK